MSAHLSITLKCLSSKSIDKTKWEACLRRSANSTIYASLDFLNAMQERWYAVVGEDTRDVDSYYSVMPFQVKVKYGIKYISQSPFIPQLDVYAVEDPSSGFKINSLATAFRRFPFIDRYTSCEPELGTFKNSTERETFLLYLHRSYHEILKCYSNNRKRDLKKALFHGLRFSIEDNIDELIELHNVTVRKRVYGFNEGQYQQLKKIWAVLNAHSQIMIGNVRNAEGDLYASALFLKHRGRITYFFAASTRKCGASTYLLDAVIRLHCNTSSNLDFKGGNISSLRKFYAGFGAEPFKLFAVTDMSMIPLLSHAKRGFVKLKRGLIKFSTMESRWFL